jgi:hypothetical protein
MFAFFRKALPLIAFCCVAWAFVSLTACGGSSSTTPGPKATSTPASVSEALPAAGQPLVFPQHAGFSGQLTVPPNNAPAGTQITLTTYTTQPSGAPAPADLSRRPMDAGKAGPLAANSVVVMWESLDFSQALMLSDQPSVQFTLPANISTTANTFTLELLITSNNPQYTWVPPTVSGQTLTFAGGNGAIEVEQATYWLELIATPITSPSPSPSPSTNPSPSPSPSASPSPSPSPSTSPSPAPCNPAAPNSNCAITFSTVAVIFPDVPPAQWGCGGNPYQVNFNAIESGYTGNFTAVSSNLQVATVAQTAPNAFTATDVWQYPGGQNGANFGIVVSDTQGNASVLDGDFNAICLP